MVWANRHISIHRIHICVLQNLKDTKGNAVMVSLPVWILGTQFLPGLWGTVSSLTAVSHLWWFSPFSPFLCYFFSLPGPSPLLILLLCLYSALLLSENKLIKVIFFLREAHFFFSVLEKNLVLIWNVDAWLSQWKGFFFFFLSETVGEKIDIYLVTNII